MDTSSSSWLSELDMQDQGFVNQLQMIRPYYLAADFSVDSSPSESNTKNSSTFVDQAFQALSMIKETNDIKSLHSYKSFNDITNKHTQIAEIPKPNPLPNISNIPNTFTISFGDQKPEDEIILFGDSFINYTTGIKKGPTTIRNRVQLQDHMLSERKRREKLAQRFLSLSALLPGRKKAAVLEDAFDYIRELQGRVKELEGLSDTKEKNMPPTASEKRLKLSHSNNSEDGNWSSDEKNFGEIHSTHCNPEIEVKMSGSSVLVRIYSQKKYVSLIEVVNEMEKLGLSITSSSSFPFGSTTFLNTIIAEKKNDFFMTSTDLVKSLQLAI